MYSLRMNRADGQRTAGLTSYKEAFCANTNYAAKIRGDRKRDANCSKA